MHSDGRITKKSSTFTYEYHLKDHLGNIRSVFSDTNGDGIVANSEVLQRKDYYAFGLDFKGAIYNSNPLASANRYGFGGKETVNDMDLGLLDFHARQLDPAIGRFMDIDALADHPSQVDKSPYNAFWNNPVKYTDSDGNCPLCPFIIIGLLMLDSQPASTPGSDKDHLTIKRAQDDF